MDSKEFEKLPYLFTILISLLGWAVQHSVDRLLERPLLEYSEKKINITDTSGDSCSFKFTNLTSDKIFKHFSIILTTKNHDSNNFIMSYKSYGMNGATTPTLSQPTKDAGGYIDVKSMQPGSSIGIDCKVSKNTELFPQISKPAEDASWDDVIYLEKKGFETFIVKDETFIYLCLAIISFAFIIFYLLFKVLKK